MADEAFALSPISARAAQPREEDYDAINEAFMETSRGRWFLGEYAKRNRNADTHMVLDAVARIEVNLAAQKQQPAPEPDHGLAEALAAIRSAVGEARSAATAALDRAVLEEAIAPIRKGARIIKEISWRWREIGADGRICDLLDSQVSAIESGCGQIAVNDPLRALGAAFDLLEGRIRRLDDSGALAEAEAVVSSPSRPSSDEMAVAAAEAAEAAAVMDDTEAAVRADAMRAEAAVAIADAADMATEPVAVTVDAFDAAVEARDVPSEAADAVAEVADIAEVADAPGESADVPAETAEDDQDAVLDLIAFEMAATDPDDAEAVDDPGRAGLQTAEPAAAEPESIAPMPEPGQTASPAIAPTMPASLQTAIEVPVEAALQTPENASVHVSLGSSLIANGIVQRPRATGPDPLAPIRRMSQAEKIALFS